ncbi:MAG TPA: DUF116 domain-containing protein [candidate division Zixibacteria bacterium]|nr:DUF116 domain-containing protein [candidate division Zixibacteria bacterium]
MTDKEARSNKPDRKLGDEWIDWDGTTQPESTEADYRVFLGLAILSTAVLIFGAALFLWLIYPRLMSAGSFLPKLFSGVFLVFAGVLALWLLLFVGAAIARRPITRLIVIPHLVNKLLDLVMTVGRVLGISRDRLTNSFLKVHNLIIRSKARRTEPDRLLLMLPRCLTKENFKDLRALRDHYGFHMATVGGGTEARRKINEIRPEMIIAIACERDLLSGFKDVNTHIPVIGFPNRRPEGPCKNTCVDLNQIEDAVKRCLGRETVSDRLEIS